MDLNTKGIINNAGYSVFCITDAMQGLFGESYSSKGCDGMWDIAMAMYDAFHMSNYDDVCRSEYDCITDFVREQGEKYLAL